MCVHIFSLTQAYTHIHLFKSERHICDRGEELEFCQILVYFTRDSAESVFVVKGITRHQNGTIFTDPFTKPPCSVDIKF